MYKFNPHRKCQQQCKHFCISFSNPLMSLSKKEKLTILQWNCRSLVKNLPHLIQFLKQNNIDIISLQSPNCSIHNLPKIPNFFYPPETNTVLNNIKIFTAIYIRTHINYIPIKDPIPPTIENTYSCSIQFKFNKKPLTIISVYLPKGPNKTTTDWLKNISHTLNNDPIVITGDFNAHSSFWESDCTSVTSKKFVENIIDSPFFLLNNDQITRIPDNPNHKPTSIDLTLISPPLAPICNWNTWHDPLNSDHLPIILTLSLKSPAIQSQTPNNNSPNFNFKKANWFQYKNNLNLMNPNPNSFTNSTIEELISFINSSILNSAKLAIPQFSFNTTKKHLGNPWWDEKCQASRNNKWTLFKKYIKNPTKENLILAKKAKNECNRTIKKAKENYWNEFCNNKINTNITSQEIWKKVKNMKNINLLPNYPIHLENNSIPSDQEKADAFVKFFCYNSTISGLDDTNKNYRKLIESTQPLNIPNDLVNNQNSIFLTITIDELINHIKSLNSNKHSLGPDHISNDMIKNLPLPFINLLLTLFNRCISDGKIPHIWKQSLIIPIHKAGKEKKNINSYRPIALTSNVCKLFEKLIQSRLLFFCNKNKIIPINQAGFCKGRSTTEHLVKLTTQIKHQFARRKSILATFFDITKAFDQVWHHKLIQKLIQINLDAPLIKLIQDFLSERLIQVKIGNSLSTRKQLDMGVPQGSVLSPLLFNIFLADLPSIISKTYDLTQFADDLSLIHIVSLKRSTPMKTIRKIEKSYQTELDKISHFIFQHSLTFSIEKTKIMLFNSGPNPNYLPKLTINKKVLNYTSSITFLGITLTSKLNWSSHFEKIINKCRSNINLLKIISSYKWGQNISSLRTLALALVRSVLSYSQEVFFNAPKYLLHKLQSIDCKAFKIALGIPIHSNNLSTYHEINVLPLDYFRSLQASKFIIKSLSQKNYCFNELNITSTVTYPKRGKTIKSLQPIRTFTNNFLEQINFNINDLAPTNTIPDIPHWNLNKPQFITNYLNTTKSQSQPHVLKILVLDFIHTNYPNHLHIFTDGSKLENNQAGAAFYIPKLNISHSFHVGLNYSNYTAELIGIEQGLLYINENITPPSDILFCVDSKATLISLQNISSKFRSHMIQHIQNLIHTIINNNINITFLWIPSHCNIHNNDKVDLLAKLGAQNHESATPILIKHDLHEYYFALNNVFKKEILNLHKLSNSTYSKFCVTSTHAISPLQIWNRSSNIKPYPVLSLINKLRLNSLKTKYLQSIKCICGHQLTVEHIISNCPKLQFSTIHNNISLEFILNSPSILFNLAQKLLISPIACLL